MSQGIGYFHVSHSQFIQAILQEVLFGGGEIARVTPGEIYQYVDEQDGWLQIKLKDGQLGWISNQYAKKQ